MILDYDEFGAYLTVEDIRDYILQLINTGKTTEDEIYQECLNYFGNIYSSLIDYAMYE
jgi:hypothetical protein